MNLFSLLAARPQPIRIGIIGAGKFGSMILAQARLIPNLHVLGVVDLDIPRARAALARVGWPASQFAARDFAEAMAQSSTFVTDDVEALLRCGQLDCIIEATGHPIAGVRHALRAIERRLHVIMVNVEADVLCGPALAARAQAAGVIYSMAYGDQPAIICEMVDWCRSCGFELVAAGKGMRFAPHFRYSTPDTVWSHYGFSEADVAAGDFNAKMFNSFTDGTKSAIEMATIANATGLDCPDDGLALPPAGAHDLARIFRPESDGGRLARAGLLDIAASLEPDGREVFNHIRFGMFVTFKAPTHYARECFRQYGLSTDPSGWYASLWRPFHLIGLETSISVLSVVLRGEATGTPLSFRGDAVATAKRDLQPGDMLDGEGGYTIWAKAIPASRSTTLGALPIGLANHVRMTRPVARDTIIRMDDVEPVAEQDIVALRHAATTNFC